MTLMLSTSHRGVQKQLSTALGVISETDFPEQWPSLLPEMVAKLQTDDYDVICGVLRTLNSICRKFRYEFATNVESQLVYVVKGLSEPLLALFKQTMTHVKATVEQPDALARVLRAVLLELKLFYSLNYIILSDMVEGQLPHYMEEFNWLLQCQVAHAAVTEHPDFDEKPGVLHKVQALLCDILALFTQKYEEEFEKFLAPFIDQSWHLLMRLNDEPKFDKLVISAITFLQTVSTSVFHEVFKNADTLKSVCDGVRAAPLARTQFCNALKTGSRAPPAGDHSEHHAARARLRNVPRPAVRVHFARQRGVGQRHAPPRRQRARQGPAQALRGGGVGHFYRLHQPAARALPRQQQRLARQRRRHVPRHGTVGHHRHAVARRVDHQPVCARARLLWRARAARGAERAAAAVALWH